MSGGYDPFAPGAFGVETRTVALPDAARDRRFTCEIWQPAGRAGAAPLVVYSHYAGGHQRAATFLAAHLASSGYVLAAVDHSETFVPALQPREGESEGDRAARIDAIIGSRVPDLRLLLDHLHGPDRGPVGLVGHSLGGWSALATADVDPRVTAVVAMAPGGSRHPTPGVLRLPLGFARSPGVPTLFLAGENDVPVPLDDVLDVYSRAPEPKRLVVLRRADHQHFVDVAGDHEALRAMDLPGPAAWMPAAMQPIGELTSPERAHAFVRGLTLAHLDAYLRADERAQAWLDSGVDDELTAHGIEAWRFPAPMGSRQA